MAELVISVRVCQECKRVFNLFDAEDADEYYNGHDCEEQE